MIRVSLALFGLLLGGFPAHSHPAFPPRHVVLIVWDGMRADFVTTENAPNLSKLAHSGVTFSHHHSAYLSATEVNGTAINTGCFPGHGGLIGNTEYRPEIDPLKPTHTEIVESIRKGDAVTHGHYLRVPTIAEIVRRAGGKTVV